MKKTVTDPRKKRKVRIRKRVRGLAERPRLSVFRSSKHIYAQVVDDTTGRVLAAASSRTKAFADLGGKKTGVEAAKTVGSMIAEKALSRSIEQVVFDRSGYLYHGRVKALADAAREKGLKF